MPVAVTSAGPLASRVLFDERWAQEGQGGLDDPGNARRVAAVADLCPSVDSLLDVGCGSGDVLRAVLAQGKARLRWGCDASIQGLLAARAAEADQAAKPGPAGSPAAPGPRCVQAAADALPFADRAFELVTCCDVLEHLPDPVADRAVAELVRVSSRYVLINVPLEEDLGWSQIRCPACGHTYHRDHHQRRYHRRQVEGLLPAAEFSLVESRTTGWTVRHPIDLPAGLGPFVGLGYAADARCERCGAHPGPLSRGRRLLRDGFIFCHNALTRPFARWPWTGVSRDSEIIALFERRERGARP